MSRPDKAPPSLATELLASLAVLALVALTLAVASVVFVTTVVEDSTRAAVWLTVLVASDVAVLVWFTASMLRRLVLLPLRESVATAEAIAGGELRRRAGTQGSREFQVLARSMNHMADRLLEERAQLVRAEKLASIGRLAAGIAHEIGNPLGAIHGYAHLLGREVAGRPGAEEALAGVERESERIDGIVRRLLDYARDRRLTPVPVDVGAALGAACALLTSQGVLRQVQVDVESPASPAVVTGDRQDMEQLFVNLLLNAVDAMEGRGRITAHIEEVSRDALLRARARRDDPPAAATMPASARPPVSREQRWLDEHREVRRVIEIIVADSGAGVPAELAERVFDPFFTTKEPGKGTGLGLAIVARIVENCGGTIGVRPAREGGAAFHILLPAAVGAA